MSRSSKIPGYATPEGTAQYKTAFTGELAEGHFRQSQGLWFSSIGIGSYLGDPDERTDALYEEALKEAIRSGANVIDSAINYRCQRSERSFGKALAELIASGEVSRQEIILCTKGGFLPFDGHYPANPLDYFEKVFIRTGLLQPEEIAQGCHAMSPRYLEHQLEQSLANLGVETVDVYYLHNPETQLVDGDRAVFQKRVQSAFEFLEEKVAEGKIRAYGMATWTGFRSALGSPEYLSLEEVLVWAREAGGGNHHFKAVQLPLNLAMPEAWVLSNQGYGGQQIPFLEVAKKLGVAVMASASLLQGHLTRPFPPEFQKLFPGLGKPSQFSLQFVRSCPGIVSALVGMKTKAHIQENLQTAKVELLSEQELVRLFQKSG